MNKSSTPATGSLIKSFTLVELIIVVIIVGILASLGLTQYNLMVEKSRLAEAKVRIGVMRDLAYSYYFENGTLTGLQYDDLGVTGLCSSSDLFAYGKSGSTATLAVLTAARCTSGGKLPNATRMYRFNLQWNPTTGQSSWHCYWDNDGSPCFGFPA
jgi:prepilin-type N-terminal cleavage/methylation domain-containing protein